MTSTRALTMGEAGFVLGRPVTAINRAVDTGVIAARRKRVGDKVQRLLGPAELRYLRLADELDKDLTPAGRRRLYAAIRKLPAGAHRLVLGELVLDLAGIDDDLKARLRKLETIDEHIERGDGLSEALVRGTRIPARLVAALARGQSLAEILEDYPSLREAQVRAAIEYDKIRPKRGRPFPERGFKRALAELAELGAFDENETPGDGSPRQIP